MQGLVSNYFSYSNKKHVWIILHIVAIYRIVKNTYRPDELNHDLDFAARKLSRLCKVV